MYAIVRSGGKQLKVQAGDVVRIERPTGDALKGIKISAKVLGEIRTRKVLVFKKKRTKQYRRTKGHRQTMIQVRIEAIEG